MAFGKCDCGLGSVPYQWRVRLLGGLVLLTYVPPELVFSTRYINARGLWPWGSAAPQVLCDIVSYAQYMVSVEATLIESSWICTHLIV